MVEDTQKRYADDVTLQELVRLRVENAAQRERLDQLARPAQMELPLTFAGYSASQPLGLVERLRDRNFPIDWQTAHEAADEIERLREALESILKIPNSEAAQGIMKTFARAALKESE